MSHHAVKTNYKKLTDRLNRFPQGAPPSENLFKILQILFTENEARQVALLPIKPFTTKTAARIWNVTETEAASVLEKLASRAILLDMELFGTQRYVLPPPMAGFFEFSIMRTRGDIDQKTLCQLFYQYLNVEEDFILDLFVDGETRLGRVFVHEETLSSEDALHVLDYERASEVIRSASVMGISICYCRHKMLHLNRNCEAPLYNCMTFNSTAASLIKNGFARQVGVNEGLEQLEAARDYNLVQFGENVRNGVAFICNCCGCCCEAMIAAKKFGHFHPVHTSNFIPRVDSIHCNGCQRCINKCPVESIELACPAIPEMQESVRAKVLEDTCLGCGVCASVCPRKAITMHHRPVRVITPVNTVHKIVVMAIEKGMLQNLIFDNHAFFSHRAMAAIIGVILRLPPLKQLMASRQMKSKYLDYLLSHL